MIKLISIFSVLPSISCTMRGCQVKKGRYDERSASWCQETGFGAASENMTQRDPSDQVCKAFSNQLVFSSLPSTQHKEPNLSWRLIKPLMWFLAPDSEAQWHSDSGNQRLPPACLFTPSFQRPHLERQKEGRKLTEWTLLSSIRWFCSQTPNWIRGKC